MSGFTTTKEGLLMGCFIAIVGLGVSMILWSIHPVLGIFGVLFLFGILNNR